MTDAPRDIAAPDDLAARARVLIEALPYMQRYRDWHDSRSQPPPLPGRPPAG